MLMKETGAHHYMQQTTERCCISEAETTNEHQHSTQMQLQGKLYLMCVRTQADGRPLFEVCNEENKSCFVITTQD
jgi:hypothetical protein